MHIVFMQTEVGLDATQLGNFCKERKFFFLFFKLVEIDFVILERFEAKSFSLKYNHMTSECKIYSIEDDLHYFKYLKIKNHIF